MSSCHNLGPNFGPNRASCHTKLKSRQAPRFCVVRITKIGSWIFHSWVAHIVAKTTGAHQMGSWGGALYYDLHIVTRMVTFSIVDIQVYSDKLPFPKRQTQQSRPPMFVFCVRQPPYLCGFAIQCMSNLQLELSKNHAQIQIYLYPSFVHRKTCRRHNKKIPIPHTFCQHLRVCSILHVLMKHEKLSTFMRSNQLR